ncbi:MAG: H-type small acid-soluble spore protein [Alicyclobacillus macrosporangiidus]|uniref:H-type small acid-soluble spore protein n=1 Tax=Alicyclobacillus macrosporangiidus TaxID=392015 RepID=UPI0026F31516|nr:H-type small acid-soluble spore protein [Alicyclobacillus macrosporangiidus]MCL6599405.1 H-type small acid-soluble spore protein [Alicyclobacillus macrosporangiidus]
MDVQRVKQILESPKIIPVEYRGQPVHIDAVYESTGYARVHLEDGTVLNAAVQELKENAHE